MTTFGNSVCLLSGACVSCEVRVMCTHNVHVKIICGCVVKLWRPVRFIFRSGDGAQPIV
jgi:hypothetical protein